MVPGISWDEMGEGKQRRFVSIHPCTGPLAMTEFL